MSILWLVLAVQAAMPTPASPPPAKPVEEKKTCRRVDTTGSIMGERTCHTKAEWDAIARANAANADQYRDRRSR